MQDLLSSTDRIELKVKQLLAKYAQLEKENAFLKLENNNLSEKLKQQKGLIKELEIKSSDKEPEQAVKLDEEERELISKNIDKQIDNIDKVINLLST